MIRKKLPYDTMLAIALMLSVLRIDWTDYLREDVLGFRTHSGYHDSILGPSVGLTETQFHNLYNSIGQTHSKSIIRDSFYYNSTVFRELDSLYEGLPLNTQSPRSLVELTAFLLDRSETSSHRSSSGQVVVPQPPQNPASVPNNHVHSNGSGNQLAQPGAQHESDSDEGFEEMETELEGAVGHAHLQTHSVSVSPTPSDELSIEDMDLIESLWRQDIDMGVCPDTYPYKADISKTGFTEELKKQGIDFWDYSIDGETGEYVPGPQQDLESEIPQTQPALPQVTHTHTQPQPQPQPQTQSQTQTQPQPQPLPHPPPPPTSELHLPPPESNLSLEDCLQLLDDEYSPETTRTDLGPGLSEQEAEQRWQDIATLPEIQGSIHELLPSAAINDTQEYAASQQHFGHGMANGTANASLASDVSELQQPQLPSNVFAVNASTNGMVSLQNATNTTSHQQPLLMTPTRNDTFQNFSNLNLNPLNHISNGTSALSSDNTTGDYLMQTLQQQMNSVNASAPYTAANLSVAENTSSLLMELLNSPGSPSTVNPLDLNFDEQMHDVLTALGEDAESLTYEEDEDSSDGSIFDSEEGATGYSSSSDQDSFKGAPGGYGFSRGHERQYGSDSSSNSYSSQPPKMENIQHNHSYASPSQSQMPNANGAQNSSYNGTNGSFKLNRDEKRAKALKLPVGVEKIVNLPVDSFNDLIKKYDLNDAQMQLIRDIRRRGKNKVAAQNCRKRKIDAITMVETVVSELRMERDKLVKERDSIDKEVSEMQARYSELCEEVFSSIQDERGAPVDPNDFTLQQLPDGTVYLVPRNGNSAPHRDREEPSM